MAQVSVLPWQHNTQQSWVDNMKSKRSQTLSNSESSPGPRKRRKVTVIQSESESDDPTFIECRRSVVAVRNIINQWRYFRQNEHFTDLYVYCGINNYGSISVHRAVMASCSTFLSTLLVDRDETHLFLPDIDRDDFVALVHLIYSDGIEDGIEKQIPSPGLLKLLGMSPLSYQVPAGPLEEFQIQDEIFPETDSAPQRQNSKKIRIRSGKDVFGNFLPEPNKCANSSSDKNNDQKQVEVEEKENSESKIVSSQTNKEEETVAPAGLDDKTKESQPDGKRNSRNKNGNNSLAVEDDIADTQIKSTNKKQKQNPRKNSIDSDSQLESQPDDDGLKTGLRDRKKVYRSHQLRNSKPALQQSSEDESDDENDPLLKHNNNKKSRKFTRSSLSRLKSTADHKRGSQNAENCSEKESQSIKSSSGNSNTKEKRDSSNSTRRSSTEDSKESASSSRDKDRKRKESTEDRRSSLDSSNLDIEEKNKQPKKIHQSKSMDDTLLQRKVLPPSLPLNQSKIKKTFEQALSELDVCDKRIGLTKSKIISPSKDKQGEAPKNCDKTKQSGDSHRKEPLGKTKSEVLLSKEQSRTTNLPGEKQSLLNRIHSREKERKQKSAEEKSNQKIAEPDLAVPESLPNSNASNKIQKSRRNSSYRDSDASSDRGSRTSLDKIQLATNSDMNRRSQLSVEKNAVQKSSSRNCTNDPNSQKIQQHVIDPKGDEEKDSNSRKEKGTPKEHSEKLQSNMEPERILSEGPVSVQATPMSKNGFSCPESDAESELEVNWKKPKNLIKMSIQNVAGDEMENLDKDKNNPEPCLNPRKGIVLRNPEYKKASPVRESKKVEVKSTSKIPEAKTDLVKNGTKKAKKNFEHEIEDMKKLPGLRSKGDLPKKVIENNKRTPTEKDSNLADKSVISNKTIDSKTKSKENVKSKEQVKKTQKHKLKEAEKTSSPKVQDELIKNVSDQKLQSDKGKTDNNPNQLKAKADEKDKPTNELIKAIARVKPAPRKLPSQCFAEAREASRHSLENQTTVLSLKKPEDDPPKSVTETTTSKPPEPSEKEIEVNPSKSRSPSSSSTSSSSSSSTSRSGSNSSASSSSSSSSSVASSSSSSSSSESDSDNDDDKDDKTTNSEQPKVQVELKSNEDKEASAKVVEAEEPMDETGGENNDNDEDSNSEWEVESLGLVLTDSAVSSVSQKKSVAEDDDDDQDLCLSPTPSTRSLLRDPTEEVFNHSLLPPPLPPRDNFLNTPVYYSVNTDNFLQTPVHPFNFTEDEIEQELQRNGSKTPIPPTQTKTIPLMPPKPQPVAVSLTQERLLSDVAKVKMSSNKFNEFSTPWGSHHAANSIDPSRTPTDGNGSRSSNSSPETQVSPEPAHAVSLTDPSRTPQDTSSASQISPKKSNPDSVNVNGLEELVADTRNVLTAMLPPKSKGVTFGGNHTRDSVPKTPNVEEESDSEDDLDCASSVTSWSEECSVVSGWTERVWSEDEEMDEEENEEGKSGGGRYLRGDPAKRVRKNVVEDEDDDDGDDLSLDNNSNDTIDVERRQVLRDLLRMDLENEEAEMEDFRGQQSGNRKRTLSNRRDIILLE